MEWAVTMRTKRQDALSRETVPFHVAASTAGLPYDPTGDTAEAAFIASETDKPQEVDWVACTWLTNLIGTYQALCLVGPGGAKALPAGRYYCWLRITVASSGELVVRQPGTLLID